MFNILLQHLPHLSAAPAALVILASAGVRAIRHLMPQGSRDRAHVWDRFFDRLQGRDDGGKQKPDDQDAKADGDLEDESRPPAQPTDED